MRPVNLIPREERRGEQAPLRSGPLAYVVVGVLVAVLVGVTALVLTNNEIAEHETEIAKLEREDAAATAKAERLAAYTQFQSLSEQRVATVASLADSRFDWERVMRELALVLPSDVWLVGLSASATPSSGGGGGGSGLRGAAPGPALELSGCAKGQEGVAGFVTALKDIEGVTRVGVQSSELPDAGNDGGGGGDSNGDECRTRNSIAKFEIVASFDAVPIPLSSPSEGSAAPVATSAPVESESSEEGSETSEGG